MSRPPMLRAGAAALAIGCALTFTACSGGDKAAEKPASAPSVPAASSAAKPSGQVYDFQAQSVPSRDGVRVELPKKLTDAMGADAAKLPVLAMTFTSRDVGDPEHCGIQTKVEYADGGFAKVSAPKPEEHDPVTNSTIKAVPGGEPAVGSRLTHGKSLPMSQLTTKDNLVDTFVSPDGQQLVTVAECSESEFSSSDDEDFYFPIFRDTEEYYIAKVSVTVMKNGTITVREGEVRGYKLDSTGEWIKK